ncbi:hypothetical protein [Pseudomonas sp. L1(2025)]|uniref:hypothetical protein n=1 Tax=Pseudomonas sp. L1(2025) TaxID=3449429 RepID=UPI003F694746
MRKEYAYIEVGATNVDSGEAHTQAWIQRTLAKSKLKPSAKALISTRSLIPVEFSIFDDSDASQSQPIIVQREEVQLWHLLNNRLPWKAFTNKQQRTANVQAKALMPAFYGEVAGELNFTQFLLSRILGEQQVQTGTWVRHILMRSPRALLKTEVVVLSVWNIRNEQMVEIWFDVPLIALGIDQWPKAISLKWPGMRIGVQSGSNFHYSTDSSQNSLWLKSFGEPVEAAMLSIYPRWTLKSVLLPVCNIEPDQQVKVTLGNLPGDAPALEYSVSVPPTYRAATRWQYYLGLYLNHRCPWVSCGVMDNDGVIRPRPEQANDWYIRCDASGATLDVQVLAQESVQWLESPRAPVSPGAPVATKTWQRWDALLSSVWSVDPTKDYIQSLVQRSLARTGLPAAVQARFKSEQQFRYKFQVGYQVYSPGVTAYAPPRYKYFSFVQVLTGEPQRTAFVQESAAAVHVGGQRLSSVEVDALRRLPDLMYDTFVADIDELIAKTDYKQLFGETCAALVKVRAAQFLADGAKQDGALCELAHRFLKGELKPRVLLFNEKKVPNAFVLKHSSQKALLISLGMTELKWVVWQPSGTGGQPSDDLMRFITHHLSFAEKNSLERSDFYPQKKRYGYHFRRVPPEPVSFQEVANLNDALYEVAITELKQMMNYLVFSSEEAQQRGKWSVLKAAARSVASLVTATVGRMSGVGALLLSGGVRLIGNVADASFSYQWAKNMDRPEDYAAYVHECKLGVLLSVVELHTDMSLAKSQLRTLLKQSVQAGRALLPVAVPRPQIAMPVTLEQAGASMLFLPTSTDLLGVRERLEKLYRDANKLAELQGYSKGTRTAGYAESAQCAQYLLSKSWEVQAIGVLMFSTHDDRQPECHYALSLRSDSDAAILDVALGNLDPSAKGLAYFDSVECWEQRMRQVPTLKDKLVVYKLYTHFAEASLELSALFPFGISWGNFFNRGNFWVLSCPPGYVAAIEGQLPRLWDALSKEMPQDSPQLLENDQPLQGYAGLLVQISNLRSLFDQSENRLRRTVGARAVNRIRAQLFGFFQSWRLEWLEEYVVLMDSVIAEEATLVSEAQAHLEQLQKGTVGPVASAQTALVDCIDWIALRAGQEDDVWRNLLHAQIERYVSGDRATADLCLSEELNLLHQALAADREVHVHHVLRPGYERLSLSTGQALFDVGLKLINTLAVSRQPDCFFALVMTCQPYENSNEHFARIVYGIHALRKKNFRVLTQAQESRLSGLPPAEPVPV